MSLVALALIVYIAPGTKPPSSTSVSLVFPLTVVRVHVQVPAREVAVVLSV